MKTFQQLLACILCSVIFLPTAYSITWGEPDIDAHPYVGLIVFDDESGPVRRCSGTLIAPTIVLTAAHCTFNAVAARIWFDTDLSSNTEYPYGGSSSIEGTPVSHPDFSGSLGATNNYDVGVIVLHEAVTDRGYAVLLPPGVLDNLSIKRGLQDSSLTPVGYGVQSIKPELSAELVRYNATSMLVNLRSALTDGYNIHASNNAGMGNGRGGACFGDSGGPTFFQDTNMVAGVASFVLNKNCVGAGLSYRVDIKESRDFLRQFISLP